jgi:hypothetical protein
MMRSSGSTSAVGEVMWSTIASLTPGARARSKAATISSDAAGSASFTTSGLAPARAQRASTIRRTAL